MPAMSESAEDAPVDPIDAAIFDRLAAVKEGGSICPSEAARALDAEQWRRMLPHVRARAVALARAGRLVVLRKGKPVDPNNFKGVYRLGLPQ